MVWFVVWGKEGIGKREWEVTEARSRYVSGVFDISEENAWCSFQFSSEIEKIGNDWFGFKA
jgi:hypothetical protein